jgi:hypothetical protein
MSFNTVLRIDEKRKKKKRRKRENDKYSVRQRSVSFYDIILH